MGSRVTRLRSLCRLYDLLACAVRIEDGEGQVSDTDTDELRWLADRLRSTDEGEAEPVIRRWLARVGVDIFDSAADEIDRPRGRVDELEWYVRSAVHELSVLLR